MYFQPNWNDYNKKKNIHYCCKFSDFVYVFSTVLHDYLENNDETKKTTKKNKKWSAVYVFVSLL